MTQVSSAASKKAPDWSLVIVFIDLATRRTANTIVIVVAVSAVPAKALACLNRNFRTQ